ncbi:6-phosphofructokinase, alpha subunit [Podochytrium sp. JEL0797]|nr:6-phosphofructokinase, alpha subunit [Podochytrium sp. JEL0797]
MGALSHITVAASSAPQAAACVLFYSALGFQVLQAADPKDKNSTDSWLQLHSAAPGEPPVALRVRNTESDKMAAFVYNNANAKLALASLNGNDADAHVDLLANDKDMKNIAARLTATKFEFVLIPHQKGNQTLLTMDPSNNLVSISNASPVPFLAVAQCTPAIANDPNHALPNTQETVPVYSMDNLSSMLDSYLPLDHVPDVAANGEQKPVEGEKKAPKKIGILTSGGDSSGMNAAVRSVTRIALQRGCVPFAIHEGYEGLVEGGDMIQKLEWSDVRGFLSVGGTLIGTARSMRMRTREGRLLAAFNMIKNGIDALIVCGGDGSLTGADLLRSEWKGLVDELVATDRLTLAECEHLREHLTIVGLVGSIDNDMSGTDITIGAFTSLHRICESLDSLTTTASSHQRAFVVEVMGRHCGWLALMAAISVGADWVFLPERPPPIDTARYGVNWEDEMCEKLLQNRKLGSRITLVIICEGAIDQNLNAIKPEYVKSILDTRLGFDTRVTNLGHVQRGGAPCAYDRYLATVQGVEAVEAVLRSTKDSPAPMIGMTYHKITAGPLMDAVKLTHEVSEAIGNRDFKKAMDLRDPDFTNAYDAYIESHLLGDSPLAEDKRMRIGIIHTGAPAGGMNTATRTAARLCLNRGHTPLAIKNGFSGLCRGEISPITWQQVIGWQSMGGSELGTNRDHPLPVPGTFAANLDITDAYATSFIECGRIAYFLQKHNIQGLMIVGGFEAYTSLLTLDAARSIFPAFCIPMIQLPATVSNNVPGTDFSLGSDTALNTIVEATDRIKQSATASQKRVFVVEVQGGNCGYLAVLGGLASGATTVYIPEEGISLDMLQRDVKHLNGRYLEEQKSNKKNEGRVIFRAEAASSTYTTQVVSNIFRHEGKGLFDSRTAVLGHLQQGGVPSPLDRIRATRMAVDCVDWIEKAFNESCEKAATAGDAISYQNLPGYTNKPEHAAVIGIQGADLVFTPVQALLEETDMNKRRGTKAWWMGLTRLIKVLAKYHFEADKRN